MKNILLLAHDDDGQAARVQVALDLARALNGHLICVGVANLPVGLAGDFYSGAGQAALLIDIEREREARNKTELEKRLSNEGVSWTWNETMDTIPAALLDAATLADLIVLNCKLDSSDQPNMLAIASSVVMQARKPVIAVPETIRRMALGRALIAWDGHPSCAGTLRACVPLLALADEIEIFMVRDGAGRIEAAEAAEYLSRHGIGATVRIVEGREGSIEDLLRAECRRWAADYLLMGAYGRGRLAETFGGVTKHLLAASPVPLVLAH